MSFLTPLFIWTDAMLKGGKVALDSMQAVAKSAKTTRVGVIPTPDAPAKASTARRRKPPMKAKRKAKARRR